MSDEPRDSGAQWRVFTPAGSLVRRWAIGGAIIGFVVSTIAMTAGAIIDGQRPTAGQIAFMLVPISGGTLQVAGIGFCVGYIVARLKRPKAQVADADRPTI